MGHRLVPEAFIPSRIPVQVLHERFDDNVATVWLGFGRSKLLVHAHRATQHVQVLEVTWRGRHGQTVTTECRKVVWFHNLTAALRALKLYVLYPRAHPDLVDDVVARACCRCTSTATSLSPPLSR